MKVASPLFRSAAFLLLALAGCTPNLKPVSSLVDNAGGRKPADFPELDADVFKPMDAGMIKAVNGSIELTPEEIRGRNTWNLWCGGNEQFWDRVAREELGLFDLLKTIDSRKHDERFKTLGLINEPGYKQATKSDRYGIWLDEAATPDQRASIRKSTAGLPV